MVRNKKAVCFALTLVLLLAGSAVAQKVTLEVSLIAGRDPNQNVVQDYGNILWTELLKQEFQKLYPNVELQFTIGDMSKTTVAIAGGVGPDLINGAGSSFHNLGVQGGFLDLTPFIATEGDDSFLLNYWGPQMSAFQHAGSLFALPDYLGTMAMYYNVDLFNNAGIHPPSPVLSQNNMDWDDFADILKKLTRDYNGDGIIDQYGMMKGLDGDRIGYWMLAAGAQYYDAEDPNRSGLNSEAAIRTLEYLQSLRFDYNTIRPGGVPQVWTNGGVAIEEGGSWLLTRRLGYDSTGAPKVPFRWNVFPMPIGPSGDRASLATTDGWAINKNTDHPELAYALLRFLAGPVANEIRATYVALQPAHREVMPAYIDLMHTMNRDAHDIDVHVFTDAAWYAYPQYFFPDHKNTDSIINGAYQAILSRNEPARSVWTEAMRRVDANIDAALSGN